MGLLSKNIFTCPSSHFKIKFNAFFHMVDKQNIRNRVDFTSISLLFFNEKKTIQTIDIFVGFFMCLFCNKTEFIHFY